MVTREAHLAIFDEAADILAAEFSRPLRIDEVAARVATSPRQLQRVFAEVSGLGFRSYLRRIRMSRAADLLTTTDIPVKAVAQRVGYGDASQFSKAFKRTHGVSPTQSRAEAAMPMNGNLSRCPQPQTVTRPPTRVPDFGREEVSKRWERF